MESQQEVEQVLKNVITELSRFPASLVLQGVQERLRNLQGTPTTIATEAFSLLDRCADRLESLALYEKVVEAFRPLEQYRRGSS